MENNYSKLEKISREGYPLDFGKILEDSFTNYKKIAGVAGAGFLIVSMIMAALIFAIIGIAFGFGNFAQTMTGFNEEIISGSGLLMVLGFSTLIGALTSPINAGMIKMAYNARHGLPFGINTIFEYYTGPHFRELFLAAILVSFFANGIDTLITYLGISIVGALCTYFILFITFLTVPLIIFSDLKAVQAISMSIRLVFRQPLILLGLLIVGIVFIILGIFGFCIGIFFTMPFLYSMYLTIYEAILPPTAASPLDEIGHNPE